MLTESSDLEKEIAPMADLVCNRPLVRAHDQLARLILFDVEESTDGLYQAAQKLREDMTAEELKYTSLQSATLYMHRKARNERWKIEGIPECVASRERVLGLFPEPWYPIQEAVDLLEKMTLPFQDDDKVPLRSVRKALVDQLVRIQQEICTWFSDEEATHDV